VIHSDGGLVAMPGRPTDVVCSAGKTAGALLWLISAPLQNTVAPAIRFTRQRSADVSHPRPLGFPFSDTAAGWTGAIHAA